MKHRALMIGAGGMAEHWLNWFLIQLADRCDVVGLVDIDAGVLEKQGRARGLWPRQCFQSTQDAFAAVKTGAIAADCAFVVIPAEFHRQAVIGALDAGLDVLTEKPLADSWEDCLAIEQATSHRKVAVIQNYRYNPAILTARKLLQERVLGDPYHVTARFRADYRDFASWSGPARHQMPNPVLADAAVHHLDQIRFLTGLNFESVACDQWRPASATGFAGGCCVSVIARLGNGVRASYEANAVCASEQQSWMAEEYRIECADGAIVVSGEQLRLERLDATALAIEQIELEPMAQRFHIKAIAEYLDWLDGAPFHGPTVADNLHSMRAVLAAIKAAETASWVSVDDIGRTCA